MTVLTEERRQIAAAIESVEGTAESLTNANAKMLVMDDGLSFEFDPDLHQRNIAQASYSRYTALVGVEPAKVTCQLELRGSGSLSTTNGQPSWDPMLRACGFGRSNLVRLNVGTITGTFRHGETVTGANGATGRVIGQWAGADGMLLVVPATGTFTTDGLTGGTSGATATTATVTNPGGWVYEPISTDEPSLTMAMHHDGLKKLMVGARGSVKIQAAVGKPALMMFEFNGVYGGVTDVALLSGITYETTVPPVFKSATVRFGTFSPKLANFEIDMATKVAPRLDASSARGIFSQRITDRDPKGSFDPELDLVANFDYYGRFQGQTLHESEFRIGSSSGNRFKVICPETQIEKVSPADRDGISVASCTVGFKGNTTNQDKEVAIACY